MTRRRWLQAILLLAAPAQGIAGLELKTASTHPMQYYLSLPQGWTAGKKWPVVVVIESANRQFKENAETFMEARQKMPFILVAPLVVTGGGSGFRSVPTYPYSDAVWSEIDRAGAFHFDDAGIAAAVADVRRLYGGEDRYFLTGWEAGGHTVWAMLFQHPERLRAVAPVSTNYLGRWMTPETFSASPARVNLPVKILQAQNLPAAFAGQTTNAIEIAKAHGYGRVSVAQIGKPHGPLAEDVLAYFASVMEQ